MLHKIALVRSRFDRERLTTFECSEVETPSENSVGGAVPSRWSDNEMTTSKAVAVGITLRTLGRRFSLSAQYG